MVERESLNFFKILRKNVKKYDNSFRNFIEKIIKKFGDNVTIVLFGSRATGRAKESSDYDVALIVRDDIDRMDFLEEVSKLREDPIPIDIIVIKISELDLNIVKKMFYNSKIIWNGLGVKLNSCKNKGR